MPEKASNPERTKDGANVPENRKWSSQDHRWEYEAQGLLEPEKLADGQDGPEDQAQTIAALTQEVATLKAERDTATAQFTEHTKVVGRFLYDMYATMIDPVEECNLKVVELCKLLLKQAGEDREQLAALATLRSENERLKQPVSDKEWLRHSSCRAEYSARATRHQVDRLIQSRITPPAPGPTGTEEKADGKTSE